MTTTHTQVQLFVKGEKLPDMDTFSKSDPYCKLFDTTGGRKTLVGKTEVVKNNLNPQFKTPMVVTFYFEMKQDMRLELWDEDKGKEDDFLGFVTFTLASVVSARNSTLVLKMSTKGTVTVTAQVVGTAKGALGLTLRGKDLKKMSTFSKTNACFKVNYLLPTGLKHCVYESEVVSKSLNPQWKPTKLLNMTDLCGGEGVTKCIAIDVYDRNKEEAMGGFLVSAEELKQAAGREFELVLKKNGKEKSYGWVCIDDVNYQQGFDFLDYLRSGLQLNIAFSIDFTGSNGPPSDPRSLHFYNPTQPNNYLRAMLAVSNVVQEYDSDRQFPAFGFGAIAPFTQGTSHFFPLNGNAQNAYCNGMQQVVDTYAALLPTLRFSGPTNFAPTIQALTQGARQARDVYTILMILTDGAITDMQDTIDAIVAADDAPLSIIILGIGNADFTSMERLDGDVEPLINRRGCVTRRDLVQFVPFNQFEGKDPAMLAAAVLEEVPKQVETWGMITRTAPSAFPK